VFGERSIPVNHPRNSSITSTTRPSGPTTVHDTTPLDGIRTRRATNPGRIPSSRLASSMTHQKLETRSDGSTSRQTGHVHHVDDNLT
jgi:hypothetical protein